MTLAEMYRFFNELRGEFLGLLLKRYGKDEESREVVRHAMEGSIKFGDAYVMAKVLAERKPQHILEIGSFLGFSTRWLLEMSKEWGATVTAVDPNIRHRIFDSPRDNVLAFNAPYVQDRLEVVTAFLGTDGDCVQWHYKKEIAADSGFEQALRNERPVLDETWGRSFDLIFIDGDHAYESAKNNFAISRHLTNPGSCMLFHDAISWDGVNQLLRELAADYKGRADVGIFAHPEIFEHPALREEPMRHIDGIGYFAPYEEALVG